jgi:uncharacterized protein YcnI
MSRVTGRIARRVAATGVVCTAALLGLTGVASAHVTANPNTAVQGGYAKVTFRVPTERDNASTTQVEIDLPADHPIASVSTRAVPGWTANVEKTPLATPLKTESGQITEAVSKITWTGGKIAPSTFEEFDVSFGPLPTDTDQLVFKALQTYDNGEVVRWIDTAAPGQPSPEHPAPSVKLTPKAAANVAAAAAPMPMAMEMPAGSTGSGSSTGNVLGIIAIVLAGLALVISVITRGRTSPATAEANKSTTE